MLNNFIEQKYFKILVSIFWILLVLLIFGFSPLTTTFISDAYDASIEISRYDTLVESLDMGYIESHNAKMYVGDYETKIYTEAIKPLKFHMWAYISIVIMLTVLLLLLLYNATKLLVKRKWTRYVVFSLLFCIVVLNIHNNYQYAVVKNLYDNEEYRQATNYSVYFNTPKIKKIQQICYIKYRNIFHYTLSIAPFRELVYDYDELENRAKTSEADKPKYEDSAKAALSRILYNYYWSIEELKARNLSAIEYATNEDVANSALEIVNFLFSPTPNMMNSIIAEKISPSDTLLNEIISNADIEKIYNTYNPLKVENIVYDEATKYTTFSMRNRSEGIISYIKLGIDYKYPVSKEFFIVGSKGLFPNEVRTFKVYLPLDPKEECLKLVDYDISYRN